MSDPALTTVLIIVYEWPALRPCLRSDSNESRFYGCGIMLNVCCPAVTSFELSLEVYLPRLDSPSSSSRIFVSLYNIALSTSYFSYSFKSRLYSSGSVKIC